MRWELKLQEVATGLIAPSWPLPLQSWVGYLLCRDSGLGAEDLDVFFWWSLAVGREAPVFHIRGELEMRMPGSWGLPQAWVTREAALGKSSSVFPSSPTSVSCSCNTMPQHAPAMLHGAWNAPRSLPAEEGRMEGHGWLCLTEAGSPLFLCLYLWNPWANLAPCPAGLCQGAQERS